MIIFVLPISFVFSFYCMTEYSFNFINNIYIIIFLRSYIVAAAKRWGLISFVPGHNGVADMTFDVRDAREDAAVIAGHFQWNAWDALPSLLHRRPDVKNLSSEAEGPLSVACFVMLREPVSRTISFYYERIFPRTKIALNAMNPIELERLVTTFFGSAYSKYRDEVRGLFFSFARMTESFTI